MKFPEDLLWGSASADFQYEGGFGEGGRGNVTGDYVTNGSHTVPRMMTYIMPDGTTGASAMRTSIPEGAKAYLDETKYYPSHQATDFYHHYKEDIQLLSDMGLNCLRFSICWGRIFPTGEEETPNEEGLAFYEDIIDTCLENNMEPLITICHDEVPVYLSDEYDGWSSRHTIDCYLKLCKALFERFSSKVKYWITFNEINVLSGFSHLGVHSCEPQATFQAVHHMFIANSLAIKMAKEYREDCMVAVMYALSPVYSLTCKPEDVFAQLDVRRRTLFYIDVMARGYYPNYADKMFKELGVEIKMEPGDEDIIKANTIDYIAFSCYRSTTASAKTKLDLTGLSFDTNPYLEQTAWGWPIDPQSIRFVCNEIYDRYQKPLFIVENGMGEVDVPDENLYVNDAYRIDYLNDHFKEIQKAVEIDKIPVLGYTMWGGVDLVSLSTGEMKKRYGWIYVDMDDLGNGTLKRVPKASYYWMKEFMETKGQNLK